MLNKNKKINFRTAESKKTSISELWRYFEVLFFSFLNTQFLIRIWKKRHHLKFMVFKIRKN